MNLKGRLRMIAHKLSEDRRVGYTTMTAKIAKELGAVMLCFNFDDARRVEKSYDVPTKSIDVNLEGVRGPVVIDHFAVTTLLQRAANKIEELEALVWLPKILPDDPDVTYKEYSFEKLNENQLLKMELERKDNEILALRAQNVMLLSKLEKNK